MSVTLRGLLFVPSGGSVSTAHVNGCRYVLNAINEWLAQLTTRRFVVDPPQVIFSDRTEAELAGVPAVDVYDRRSILWELLDRNLIAFDPPILHCIFNLAQQVGRVDTCGLDFYGHRPFPGVASRGGDVLPFPDPGKIGQTCHEIVTHAVTVGLKHPWDYSPWEVAQVALAEGYSRTVENGIVTWRYPYLGIPRVVKESDFNWKLSMAWALADRTVSGAWWRWGNWADGGLGLLKQEIAILRGLPWW